MAGRDDYLHHYAGSCIFMIRGQVLGNCLIILLIMAIPIMELIIEVKSLIGMVMDTHIPIWHITLKIIQYGQEMVKGEKM